MTINTYLTLKTAITSWSRRSDLSANLDDFIDLAEDMMVNGNAAAGVPPLRCTQMETRSTIIVSAGDNTADVPTRFLELMDLHVSDGGELTLVPYATLNDMYVNASSGTPKYYAMRGSTIVLFPTPSAATTLYANCMIAPAPLTSTAVNNAVFLKYPSIYLYGSLMALFGFTRNDNEQAKYAKLFAGAIKSANTASTKTRMSGTQSRPRTRRNIP